MEVIHNLFFGIISYFFLYFNYKIIVSDIKEKIIPNKYIKNLLFIVPLYYISLFIITPSFLVHISTIHVGFYLLQMFITILIGFSLYYFGLWGAGDAKYLVVLGFFIPHIGIIPFIANISLIVIGYLFIYFLWFYFGKCLTKKGYAKWIFTGIKKDLFDKFLIFAKNTEQEKINKKNAFLKIIKWFIFFLVIFVSLRLFRIYLLDDIKKSDSYENLGHFFSNYPLYLALGLILFFFLFMFLIRYIFNKGKDFMQKKNILLSDTTFLSILGFILISFIFYEYTINAVEIKNYLIRIFTTYLSIYLIFKILKYSYHITFQVHEQDFIKIERLKTGDIVDKDYLIKIFGEQGCLGHCFNINSEKEREMKKDGLLFPSPKEYFSEIQNPIDEETKDILLKIYNTVNTYHENNNTPQFNKVFDIKILKTFALSWYIFFGFITTFFLGNKIFEMIFGYIGSFIFPY